MSKSRSTKASSYANKNKWLLMFFVFTWFSWIFRLRLRFFSCVLSLVQRSCTLVSFLQQFSFNKKQKIWGELVLLRKHYDFPLKCSSRMALGPILGLPWTSLGLFLANFGGPFGSVSSPVCAGRFPRSTIRSKNQFYNVEPVNKNKKITKNRISFAIF